MLKSTSLFPLQTPISYHGASAVWRRPAVLWPAEVEGPRPPGNAAMIDTEGD